MISKGFVQGKLWNVFLWSALLLTVVGAQMTTLSTMTLGMVMTMTESNSMESSSTLGASSSSTIGANSSVTSSAPPQHHTVTVGKGDHRFIPETLSANIGDTIHFEFFPANHSVIRSTWDQPCIPYEDFVPSDPQGAIWSGWQPVDMVMEDYEMPWWNYTLTISDPLFLYCGAAGSCNGRGMVMIVNGNSSYPINTYRKNALAAPYILVPGQPFPDSEVSVNSLTSSPTMTTATSIPATDTSSISSTTTPTPATITPIANSSHNGISVGAIAGIVIGGIACIALVGLLFLFIGRRRPSQEARDRALVAEMIHDNARHPANPYFSPASPAPGPPPLGPARETVIIPMTEAEKAMYLERIQAMSPVQNTPGSPLHERDARDLRETGTPATTWNGQPVEM